MKRNVILTCDQKPYSPQHNEVYENNAYAEMLVFLFLIVTCFQCLTNALYMSPMETHPVISGR